jgi:hypothetical protein
MFLSSMWIGRKHDNVRLAPGPCRRPGRNAENRKNPELPNHLKDSEDNRKMCSLYLSLMDRYGGKMDSFGDSAIRLERL